MTLIKIGLCCLKLGNKLVCFPFTVLFHNVFQREVTFMQKLCICFPDNIQVTDKQLFAGGLLRALKY